MSMADFKVTKAGTGWAGPRYLARSRFVCVCLISLLSGVVYPRLDAVLESKGVFGMDCGRITGVVVARRCHAILWSVRSNLICRSLAPASHLIRAHVHRTPRWWR